MTKRIEKLTDEHRATFPEWVDRWTAIGLRTGPLSKDEWAQVEAAARKEYGYAGKSEPRLVLGVRSPLAAAIVVSIAREVAPAAAKHFSREADGAGVGDGVGAGVWAGVWAGVGDGVGAGVWDGVRAGVGAGVRDGVWAGVWDGVRAGVGAGVWDGVRAGVGAGVRAGVGDGVWAGVWDGVWAGVRDGVGAGVRDGVRAGVRDGVRAGVRAGVRDPSSELLAPFQEWLHDPILRGLQNAKNVWYNEYQGGNLWCSYNAWLTWFRDVGELELKGDLWDRLEADNTMMLAGPSWWYQNLCVISDRPTVINVEWANDMNRLHCETGPAIAWADGWGIYSWHGTQVPADLIEGDGWDTDRILREPNAEIRRCAIERRGWDWFIDQAGLAQIGETVPDPGNPGQTLSLYAIPEQIYDEPVRVLLCTNATQERDGSRHRFGLTVPGSISDPVAAAAWTFGLNPSEYRTLERAS